MRMSRYSYFRHLLFDRWLPEIQHLEDDRQRMLAWGIIEKQHRVRLFLVRFLIPFVVCVAYLVTFRDVFLSMDRVGRILWLALGVLFFFIMILSGLLGGVVFFRRRLRIALRRLLNQWGCATCEACGYRLVGAHPVCPECGAAKDTESRGGV